MKTIGILFFFFSILGLQSQTSQHKHCSLDFKGSQWVLSHHDSVHQNCNAIYIKSVPPVSIAYTPIDLTMTVKGIYSIKKDPSLELDGDYDVVVEDLLTGQYYDLSSPETYTFRVNRVADRRFVLEINKKSLKPGHGATASR